MVLEGYRKGALIERSAWSLRGVMAWSELHLLEFAECLALWEAQYDSIQECLLKTTNIPQEKEEVVPVQKPSSHRMHLKACDFTCQRLMY